MNILDALKDIVKHTGSLGFIDAVKVIGTATDAKIETKDADSTVIIFGNLKDPIAGIESTIGLARLAILKGTIGMHEGSKVSIVNETRGTVSYPAEILFDNNNEFLSHYRFMAESMINEYIKVPPFKGATWNITITPLKNAINRLSESYGVLGAFEKRFTVEVKKGILKFNIGRGAADNHSVPFATDVVGELKHQWTYPLAQTLSILKLADTSAVATMSFSDMGAMKIDIDSGLGKYSYILPAGKE